MIVDEAMGTPAEEPAPADDLDSLITEATSTHSEEPEATPEAAPEEPKQQEAVEEPNEPPKEEPKAEEPAKSEAAPEPLSAPQNWAKEHRDTFDQLPRDAQDFLLSRHKDMEGAFTKKTQEISDTRKFAESMNAAIQPYQEELRMLGVEPAKAVTQLLALAKYSRENPQAYFQMVRQWTQQQTGGDPTQVEDDPEPVDPQIAALRAQVQQTQTALQTIVQNSQQQQQTQLDQTIQAFASAVDDQGKPTHPHFEALRPAMAVLMQAQQASTLDEAYDKALWANPELRKTMVEAEREKVLRAEREKAETEKAANAKGVESSPATAAETSDGMSLDQLLSKSLNSAGV